MYKEEYMNKRQEEKRKRRRALAEGRKKYEVDTNFSWNGRCLTIEPTRHYKEEKAEKIRQEHMLSRTNLTLVTGQPNNGKLDFVENMLERRKYESVRQHIKEKENKEKMEGYRAWLRQFGKQPYEVPDRIYDLYVTKYFDKVLDNDRNKMDMVSLIDNKQSTFGHKCRLMVFEILPEESRKDAFNRFLDEVKQSMALKTLVEDYEKEVYDEEKNETHIEVVKREFPQIPDNILAVADFTTEERKEFLRELNAFRFLNFIKCFNTCLIYDVKSKEKSKFDYSHPTAIEGWNQVNYLDKNGKVIHIDKYHDDLLFAEED